MKRRVRRSHGRTVSLGAHAAALESRVLLSTVTVTSLADNEDLDGLVTLREAIRAANEDVSVDGSVAGSGGDRIVFAPGLVGELRVGQALEVTDSLTVRGLGREQTRIRANFNTRIFVVPETAVAGMRLQIERLRLTRSEFAVSFELPGGELVINQARIRNNLVGVRSVADTTLRETELFANGTRDGTFLARGVVVGNGTDRVTVNVNRSEFQQNEARQSVGGGLHVTRGTVTVRESTFHGNQASRSGGGLHATDSDVTITAATFDANVADNGGGIAVERGTLTLTHTTISGNTIRRNVGSAIQFENGELIVGHTTITANTTSDASGSAVDIRYNGRTTNAHFGHTIIAGNDQASSADPVVQVRRDTRADVTFESSFLGIDTDSGLLPNGGVPDEDGNLVGAFDAPLDPMLGPLSENGGASRTHLPSLLSLVVDAAATTVDVQNDQRGPGFVRVAGTAADIGAVELSDTAFEVGPIRSVVPEASQSPQAEFAVTLRRQLPGPINVAVSTVDDVAQSSRGDYTPLNSTLSFSGVAGETLRFAVNILDDAEFEPAERLLVRLESEPATGRPPLPQAEVLIESDETTGVGLFGSILKIESNGQEDIAAVSQVGGEIVGELNGLTNRFPASAVAGISARLGPGDDRFTAQGGLAIDSTIVAGAGDDTVITGDGNDEVRSGSGNDLVRSKLGKDLISSASGRDTVDAGGGNDTVDAGPGNDMVVGLGGADLIFGRGGRDTLDGGARDDTLMGGASHDVIIGGPDNDALFGFSDFDIDPLWESEGPDGFDRVDAGSGDDFAIGDEVLGGEGADELFGHELADGGPGDDEIRGSGVLRGRDGDDLIRAVDPPSGSDIGTRILGGAGNDTLRGGAGADTVQGGDGDDEAHGGNGDDVLQGEAGRDTLFGGSGSDTLSGNAGRDVLDGGHGNDRLDGGSGRDMLIGGHSDDFLNGGNGGDALDGGAGRDILQGADGPDHIRGGDARDILVGGPGGDDLDGQAAQDIVIAGTTSLSDADLVAVRSEWAGLPEYDLTTRIANLTDGSGSVDRRNGDAFLVSAVGPEQSVFDDLAADRALGGPDTDWLFVNPAQDENDGDLFG